MAVHSYCEAWQGQKLKPEAARARAGRKERQAADKHRKKVVRRTAQLSQAPSSTGEEDSAGKHWASTEQGHSWRLPAV